MRSLCAVLIGLGVCASLCTASTPPVLLLSDAAGNIITIDSTGVAVFSGNASCSGGVTCSSAAGFPHVAAGTVSWSGQIGAFNVGLVTGSTKPLLPLPLMDLALQNVTTGATGGTLTVKWTDVGFFGSGFFGLTESSILSGTGSYSFSSYFDTTNAAFGTGNLIGTLGPFTSSGTQSLAGPAVPNSVYSMTEVVALTLGANSSFGTDDIVRAQPPLLSCRFTGGGVDTSGNWDHTDTNGQMVHNTAHNLPPTIDRYTMGGQVGAPTASQPQPHGNWEHHQQTGPSGSFNFHGGDGNVLGTRILAVRCSDPGACRQATANAPNKQLDFDAIGTFQDLGNGPSAPNFLIPNANVVVDSKNNFTYHYFQVNIDDLGEPGGTNTGTMDPNLCPSRGFGEDSAGPYTNPTTGVTTVLPFAPLGNCACPDFYRIRIYNGVAANKVTYLPDGRVDPASLDQTTVIYEVFGYIDGGNLQLHPAI